MRNIALAACPCTYAILLDVDFTVSHGFHAKAMRWMKQRGRLALMGGQGAAQARRTALVVPAFEVDSAVLESWDWVKNAAGSDDDSGGSSTGTGSSKKTKQAQSQSMYLTKDLIARHGRSDTLVHNATGKLRRSGSDTRSEARPFQQKHYKDGHHVTDTERWYTAEEPYEVTYQFGYEPYLLLQAPFPRYDERFIGYGQNKVSYGYELAAAGFAFHVLPDLFIVHHHEDETIGVAVGEAVKVKKQKDWSNGWSCWTGFADAVADHYHFRAHEPCWVAEYVWPVMIKSGQEHGVCITDCLWEEHLLRVKAKASTTTMATLPRRCTHPVMTQWRQQSGVVV